MARNIEVKARDDDPAATKARAIAFGAAPVAVLEQADTYFGARDGGRLKLREQDGAAELIGYVRPDEARVRASDYVVVPVPDPAALKAALDLALGTIVVVVKRRELLRWRDVRVHLDAVEGLGTFVELESVVGDAGEAAAQADADAMAHALGLGEVEARGYAQLLLSAS